MNEATLQHNPVQKVLLLLFTHFNISLTLATSVTVVMTEKALPTDVLGWWDGYVDLSCNH
jgi:hypothetical protein